jgi:hypothetical protein
MSASGNKLGLDYSVFDLRPDWPILSAHQFHFRYVIFVGHLVEAGGKI